MVHFEMIKASANSGNTCRETAPQAFICRSPPIVDREVEDLGSTTERAFSDGRTAVVDATRLDAMTIRKSLVWNKSINVVRLSNGALHIPVVLHSHLTSSKPILSQRLYVRG